MPIRVEATQPASTPQATSPQPPQTVVMQDQRQVRPNVDGDQAQTEGSAAAMLQKAYQRMTAPAAPGGQPDHTLALMTAGLAFVTIGIGVFVAARWSLHREKQRQQPAWASKDRTAGHQTIGQQDARYQVYRVADVRSVEDQRFDDHSFEEQQVPAQTLDEPRVVQRDRPQPEDFFAAVTAKPNAKAAHAYQQREALHEYASEPSVTTNCCANSIPSWKHPQRPRPQLRNCRAPSAMGRLGRTGRVHVWPAAVYVWPEAFVSRFRRQRH
jgi:hypothetical protein